MHAAILDSRGVVEVSDTEAGELLQRLVTNDVLRLGPAEARYAALLSPQGKIIVDFLVVARSQNGETGYLLDCPRALASDLTRRLTMYRLRAKVRIVDRSAEIGIAAVWPGRPDMAGLVYRDPRAEEIGYRVAAPRADLAAWIGTSNDGPYHRMRIGVGVPEGGLDFPYGESFPHDVNLDRLKGVDFTKGCYVGQEVVSRVQHRGTARKRVAAVTFEGDAPPPGSDVMVGEIVLGTMGSAKEGHGLALVRMDRVAEAAAVGAQVTCAGTPLMIAPL